MLTLPVLKRAQVIDSKCAQPRKRVVELLLEENRSLRQSATAFGELAERLNLQLQEARRGRAGEPPVPAEPDACTCRIASQDPRR
jgi:hypothetical protein